MKQNEEESTACQGQKIAEEPSGKNWAEIPRDCQKLGILELCSKAKVGLRQFKGGAKKHKEREQISPYQPSNDAEKES